MRPADTVRLQVNYLPSSLNPLLSQDFLVKLVAFRTIFEPLVVVSANGDYQPFLAASLEPLDHGRRFHITLRSNVRFHDGRPLTSGDVKYTMDEVLKRARKNRGSLSLLYAELEQVVDLHVVNDLELDLVLRRRNYLFPSVLAEVPILPAHLYHCRGLGNPQLNRAPVGTGPFKLAPSPAVSQAEHPGQPAAVGSAAGPEDRRQLTLVRNPDYWGQRPRLASLVFDAVSDPARALARLRNGELDLIPQLHPSYYPDQVKGERMTRRFRLLRIHPYRMRVMLYNLRSGMVKDRRIRLALAHLTDRGRLVREMRNTLGQVISTPVWPLSSWFDSSVPHPYPYDRAVAARLLDAAGWLKQPGKLRQKQGHPLRMRLLVAREAPRMAQVAAMLKTELLLAGIRLEVKTGDFGFVKSQLQRGNFDLALVGLAPRPESDLSPLLHSKGRLNLGHYDFPAVDRLLDAIRAIGPQGNRLRLLRQLYRVIHGEPPFLILYAPIELILVDREVSGLANNGRWPLLPALAR